MGKGQKFNSAYYTYVTGHNFYLQSYNQERLHKTFLEVQASKVKFQTYETNPSEKRLRVGGEHGCRKGMWWSSESPGQQGAEEHRACHLSLRLRHATGERARGKHHGNRTLCLHAHSSIARSCALCGGAEQHHHRVGKRVTSARGGAGNRPQGPWKTSTGLLQRPPKRGHQPGSLQTTSRSFHEKRSFTVTGWPD